MNNCDGCQRGLKIMGGDHYDVHGRIVMGCTKKRYSTVKMEVIDDHRKEEYLMAQCGLGHTWGDGKNVDLNSKCPACGGDVMGTLERRIMSIDAAKAKGWMGSKGT